MISLGTAQFGSKYGICNTKGIVKEPQIKKILKYCTKNRIFSIDTASGYGKSQKVLGKNSLKKFRITSKLSSIKKLKIKNFEKYIILQVDKILKDLGVKKIDNMLIHDSSQLNGKFGKNLYRILNKLKNKKFKKLGVSVYTKRELEKVINEYKIDVVSIPISVANQSFVKDNYLLKIKRKNIEIHARSIFLQGLLLRKNVNLPKQFRKNKFFYEWERWLKKNNYNALEASLGFLKNLEHIDKIIVGIDNLDQVRDIVKAYKKKKNFKYMNFSQLSILKKPSEW